MVAQHLEKDRHAAASESEGQHLARNTATHKANEKLRQGRGPNCVSALFWLVLILALRLCCAFVPVSCPRIVEINVNVMKVPQMAEPKPMGK